MKLRCYPIVAMFKKLIKFFSYCLFFFLFVLLLVVTILYLFPEAFEPTREVDYTNSELVWKEFQAYREKFNLIKLEKTPQLCSLATTRAQKSIDNWSHDGFEDVYQEIGKPLGYRYLGENLSSKHINPRELIGAWATSPKHREIMDNPHIKYGCISCYNSNCALLTAY